MKEMLGGGVGNGVSNGGSIGAACEGGRGVNCNGDGSGGSVVRKEMLC